MERMRRTHGLLVDVELHVTHPLPQLACECAPPPSWCGCGGVVLPHSYDEGRLPVNVTVHSPKVGWELAGRYRRRFAQSVLNGEHDWYMYAEDDLMLTEDHLQGLCAANRQLRDSEQVLPWLMRYQCTNGTELAADRAHARASLESCYLFEHHKQKRLRIEGTDYFSPESIYTGCWFASARQLRARLVGGRCASNSHADWLALRPISSGCDDNGQHCKVKNDAREYYAGIWLQNCAVRHLVVPYGSFRSFLIHHATDKKLYLRARPKHTPGAYLDAMDRMPPQRSGYRADLMF